jgi:hypothetical protein
MSSNAFRGLPLNQLIQLQATYLDAMVALAQNQSYSRPGLSLTRADLGQVRQTLADINDALQTAQGRRRRRTVTNFRHARE